MLWLVNFWTVRKNGGPCVPHVQGFQRLQERYVSLESTWQLSNHLEAKC